MPVQWLEVQEEHAGQRIDNFVVAVFRRIPKSRLYRALRSGEVRVNGKRIKPIYRVQIGDKVRLPPFEEQVDEIPQLIRPSDELVNLLTSRAIIESPQLIWLNKPAGIPVHGGTGIQSGVVEALRWMRPHVKGMELVHRLDRDTSGCLLIAKKRQTLLELHSLFVNGKIEKRYLLLVKGAWKGGVKEVMAPLVKNHLQSGERMVRVHPEGKAAATVFVPIHVMNKVSLVEALPKTGRTHQIRVHAAHLGYPIVGDIKYGDDQFNKAVAKMLKEHRLFLHAASLTFKLGQEQYAMCAPLDDVWHQALKLFCDHS